MSIYLTFTSAGRAETVADFRRDGLVNAKSHRTDGRKTPMSITASGRKLISSINPVREAWFEAAIEQYLTATDRRTLLKAADTMERLADC